MYREKPSKAAKRKSVSIVEPGSHNALVPRKAYVEDDPDGDAPPAVPSPPPAVPVQPVEPVNVFDYLVNEDTPNASRSSLTGPRESMALKKDAPSVFMEAKGNRSSSRNGYRNREEQAHDENYTEHGFSYGTEPVNPLPYPNPNASLVSLEFMTPSAKATRAKLDRERPGHSRTNSGNASDKKRKRAHTEEQRYELEGDTFMPDAPSRAIVKADTPGLAHSGLTGGLNRLLSHTDPFPPSPEYSDDRDREKERDRSNRNSRKQEDPASPLKRTRHSKDDSGLGISIKGRANKVMSMVGGALINPAGAQNGSLNRETALVKTARRTSSSDDGQTRGRESQSQVRERKKHKVHRAHGSTAVRHERSSHHSRSKRRGSNDHDRSRSPERERRKVKAIEYHKHDSRDNESVSAESDEDDYPESRNGKMVVFGKDERARLRGETFLSVVTKGPESEKGYSINKALKRWHRDGAAGSSSKYDEEKELWKSLRLKRNENGEVVIFAAS